jgi:hypothetical protein
MSESRVCEDPFATPFRVPHAENGLHWGHKIMLSVVLYQTRWEDELRVIAVMRGFYVVMWLRGGSIRTVVRLVVGTRQALRVFGSSRSIYCEYQGRLACSIELRNSPSIWKRTELLMHCEIIPISGPPDPVKGEWEEGVEGEWGEVVEGGWEEGVGGDLAGRDPQT